MSVVETKSGAITNRDATPAVKNPPYLEGGMLRESVATVEIATGDTSTSIYRMVQVPSNARISRILLYSDDCGTATVIDVGVYQTTANGGAVVDQDYFASSVDIHSGALNASDITHEAAVTSTSDINGVEKMLWQGLALSADPNIMYDICATLTVTADVGGTLTLKVLYVV